jgi:hypothetical protein
LALQRVGFEDGEAENVEGLLGVPAELSASNPDEENTVRNPGPRIMSGFSETANLALHATTSCFGRA